MNVNITVLNNIIFIILFSLLVLFIIFKSIEFNKFKKETKLHWATSSKKEYNERLVELILSSDNINLVDSVNRLIDNLIKEAGNLYMIFNINHDKDKYITEKETEIITKYIYGMVMKNMTKDIRHIISLVYNIDTEDQLKEIINLRIKLYMINLLVNNHKPV